VIIGIDPGTTNGVAVYKAGKLGTLSSFSVIDLVDWLKQTLTQDCLVIIEDSRLQSFMFSSAKQPRAQALKIARNVGMVDQVCKMIEDTCDCRCPVMRISPKLKGAKIDAKEFKSVTGWSDASNQHTRDAAMVAYPYRNKQRTTK
jgi:hypothetical protein